MKLTKQQWFDAIKAGDLSRVKILSKYFIGCLNAESCSGIHVAAVNNRPSIVQFLLPHESRMKTSNGETALMLAAKRNFEEVVKLLVPVESRMVTAKNVTALEIAAVQGNINIVRLLAVHELQFGLQAYCAARSKK